MVSMGSSTLFVRQKTDVEERPGGEYQIFAIFNNTFEIDRFGRNGRDIRMRGDRWHVTDCRY